MCTVISQDYGTSSYIKGNIGCMLKLTREKSHAITIMHFLHYTGSLLQITVYRYVSAFHTGTRMTCYLISMHISNIHNSTPLQFIHPSLIAQTLSIHIVLAQCWIRTMVKGWILLNRVYLLTMTAMAYSRMCDNGHDSLAVCCNLTVRFILPIV